MGRGRVPGQYRRKPNTTDDFATFGAGAPPAPDRGTPVHARSVSSFKHVCCTNSNLRFEAENLVSSTRQTEDDTIFCAVPLHHSCGIGNGLLDAAYAGATLMLELTRSVGRPEGITCLPSTPLMRNEELAGRPESPAEPEPALGDHAHRSSTPSRR